MSDRKQYMAGYMRQRRAKEREAKATGQATQASEGFTDRQLEQMRQVIGEELKTLFTGLAVSKVNKLKRKFTPVNVNTADKAFTGANVNPEVRICPHCGGNVTGRRGAVYCSANCRKLAWAKNHRKHKP